MTDPTFTALADALSAPGCVWCNCGDEHRVESCPRVKAVEYAADGSIRRVEKFSPREITTIPAPLAPAPPGVWSSDLYASHYV